MRNSTPKIFTALAKGAMMFVCCIASVPVCSEVYSCMVNEVVYHWIRELGLQRLIKMIHSTNVEE